LPKNLVINLNKGGKNGKKWIRLSNYKN
jgi:hypothetical protein